MVPLLPSGATGRLRRDDRTTLAGVFRKSRSDVAWPDVPKRYGPYRTVYDR